jgi:hypothetical protein
MPESPNEDVELERIRLYEPTQREICATARARFDPPDYHKLISLAPSLLDGRLPVRGERHVGETVEWYMWADDLPRAPIEELSMQHLHHLATLREDLVMYLALPIGWSFTVLADELRSWAAFSPSDHLRFDVDAFLSAGASPETAETIKDVLDESFADVPDAREVSELLGTFLAFGLEPSELAPKLRTIVDRVRGTPGDGRIG